MAQAQKTKRLDYLSWDEYFMAVAFLSAERSKDPVTQVIYLISMCLCVSVETVFSSLLVYSILFMHLC